MNANWLISVKWVDVKLKCKIKKLYLFIVPTLLVIMFFTISCVRDEEELLPKEKFQVGQKHQGGIVAYVDNIFAEHGFIAAAEDFIMDMQWYDGQYYNAPHISTNPYKGDGKLNTIEIVKTQGNGFYAAKLCDDLVLNGYDDWHLPSIYELQELFINRDKIGGFDENAFYWSSTEDDDTTNPNGIYSSANCMYFKTGGFWWYVKSAPLKVRAIRYF